MLTDFYHILRYGTHAEQKYFLKANKTYTTIAVNGNMVAHAPAAIASFISDMLLQNNKMNYFIDPITHAFQHNPVFLMAKEKGEKSPTIFNPDKIKKSVKSLLGSYGNKLSNIILEQKRALLPSDFDTDFIVSFCDRVINYQNNVLVEELNRKGIVDYIKFAESYTNADFNFHPHFLVAPYFYLDSSLEWLKINVKLTEQTLKMNKNENIAIQIVMSQDILSDDRLYTMIAKEYISLVSKPTQILLWIDNFNGAETNRRLLDNFINLLKLFKENGISVINLYGDFFSEALIKYNYLNGVGHAFEYGESRSVVPVGGGLPANKYYFHDIHTRVSYSDASRILYALGYFDDSPQSDRYKKYLSNICSCPVCKEILSDSMDNFSLFESTKIAVIKKSNGATQKRMYADATTKEICVMHYQFSKYREFKELAKYSKGDLIQSLKDCEDKYSKLIPRDSINFLSMWADILESL